MECMDSSGVLFMLTHIQLKVLFNLFNIGDIRGRIRGMSHKIYWYVK